MSNYIVPYDVYEEDGYGKYPVLESDTFCYFKYGDDEETLEDLIRNHSDGDYNLYTVIYCCVEAEVDKNNCSCDEGTYYFVSVICAKTNLRYYLISSHVDPQYCEEEDWFCIGNHPLNIALFKNKIKKPPLEKLN